MRYDIEGGGGGGSQTPRDLTRNYGTYVDPMQAFYGRAMQRGSPMVTAQNPGVTYKQDVPRGGNPLSNLGLSVGDLLGLLETRREGDPLYEKAKTVANINPNSTDPEVIKTRASNEMAAQIVKELIGERGDPVRYLNWLQNQPTTDKRLMFVPMPWTGPTKMPGTAGDHLANPPGTTNIEEQKKRGRYT